MVAQILANALELVANLDADAFEQFRLADAGQFQKLRRIDRTGADDDFPVGASFVPLSVYIVAHPDAALAFDQQAFGQRIGLDGQVWPPSRPIQIADGGAHPTTTADRRLGHADTVLHRAVVVLGVGDADLAGRLDQRVVDRSALVAFGDLQRPAAAAVLAGGVTLVTFHVPENRQDLPVTPAAIAELRPGIVVVRLATDKDHPVDRRRPAQKLTARNGNAPLAGTLVGLRRIQPVGGRVFDQPRESYRDPRPGRAFPAPLKHQDPVLAVDAQSVRQHRSGGSRTHHDIIKDLVFHFEPSFSDFPGPMPPRLRSYPIPL